jgi:hypothetical protein
MYKLRQTGRAFELSLPLVHCILKYLLLSAALTLYNPLQTCKRSHSRYFIRRTYVKITYNCGDNSDFENCDITLLCVLESYYCCLFKVSGAGCI